MKIVGTEVKKCVQEGLNRCVRKCDVSLKKISKHERKSVGSSERCCVVPRHQL